jgi:spore coat-associated protein N
MKRILFGLMALVIIIGIVGSAFAYFTDVETSTGNTFTVATFNLQVADTDEWFGNSVSTAWTMSNMVPGVTTVGPFSVTLHNSATITGDHVEIGFSHTIDAISNPATTPGEMAKWIEITSMTYDNVDLTTNYLDANGNGIFDLEDVTLSPYADAGGRLDNLPAPVGAGIRTFTMALKLSQYAPNDIQEDVLTTTVAFTLNQDSTQ